MNRVEAWSEALDYMRRPMVIDREDMKVFSLLLANNLEQFGAKVDPDAAWLALADSHVEYTLAKEKLGKLSPEKVFTDKQLEEFRKKGWI